MAKTLITENYIEDIAEAIREKLDVDDTYYPSEMADAIESIPTYPEPVGVKNITANGNGIDVKDYASANVNVPNTYGASDEGKVVSNGVLVAQTSDNITSNGTYDTTLKNEVVVNVEGGGGSGKTVLIDPDVLSSIGNAINGDNKFDIPCAVISRANTSILFTSHSSSTGRYGNIFVCTYNNVSSWYIAYISSNAYVQIPKKIPASCQKLYIDCEVKTCEGQWGGTRIDLVGSVGISSRTQPSGTNFKSVTLCGVNATAASINGQSGVVINSTDGKVLPRQIVEIDLSGISDDCYFGFWTITTQLHIYGMYAE